MRGKGAFVVWAVEILDGVERFVARIRWGVAGGWFNLPPGLARMLLRFFAMSLFSALLQTPLQRQVLVTGALILGAHVILHFLIWRFRCGLREDQIVHVRTGSDEVQVCRILRLPIGGGTAVVADLKTQRIRFVDRNQIFVA